MHVKGAASHMTIPCLGDAGMHAMRCGKGPGRCSDTPMHGDMMKRTWWFMNDDARMTVGMGGDVLVWFGMNAVSCAR